MQLKAITLGAVAGFAAVFAAGHAEARDRIQIVGSSTVFPYTQAVAEEFANNTGTQAPVVESTGTGGGMKLFCQGVGEGTADITGASRAMKESEWALCNGNGVTDITEILIGYDGLSIAVSRNGTALDLTKAEIYLALASQIPGDGELVDNTNMSWSDVSSALPDIAIQVFGPPPTSGTRDAFVELAMREGCQELPFFQALRESPERDDYKKYVKENCSRMRQDGPFVEAGENDNLIVQRLDADPTAYGIFGYSFLFENQDRLQAVNVESVAPSMETIGDGSYSISRPLFVYVKNAHRGVMPGLDEFVEEYVSEASMGPDGYLSERGLVVLPDEIRSGVQDAATQSGGMTRFTN